MNGDVRPAVNKILTAIEHGNLTHEETVRRIEALIQAEVNKKEANADLDLISACENLLDELNLHQTVSPEGRMADTKEKVMARIQSAKRRNKAWACVVRTAAAAAAVMLLLVAIDVIFDRGWFSKHSTVDEQQYVVQGQAVDPNLIGESAAKNTPSTFKLVTTSYDELVSFLGYEPILPSWLPSKYQLVKYQASRHSEEEIIATQYVDSDSNEDVQYTQVYYYQIADAHISFEQSVEGEILMFNSMKVYKSENLEKVRYNWSIGHNVFTLAGTLTDEIAINMILSTLEEQNE